jgi:hypothetical protein
VKRWLLGVLLLWATQGFADPQVRVETRLQPSPPFETGSTLRLEIDLLTTTWFTAAPQPPALELPGMLVTPPNGQGDNLTLSIDGEIWFGLRLTYLLTPTEPGQRRIPELPFELQVGQASGPMQVNTQALDFNVSGAALDSTSANRLVASDVRMTQQIEGDKDSLQVGDRLTRRIRIEADGAQAMLIPPLEFVEIQGLKRYPHPPEVKPLSDGRGSIDGGLRIDSVSYVVEQPGSYLLPELELHWGNSHTRAEQVSRVPAIEFKAERGAGYGLPFSLEADLRKLGQGRLIKLSLPGIMLICVVLLLGLCAWLWRQRLREIVGQMGELQRRLHDRWQASEAFAWRNLQRALHSNPLPLAELYRWQLRSQGHTDLQLLISRLPPDAGACLQRRLRQNFATSATATQGDDDLHRGLRQLRKQIRRNALLKSTQLHLKPLNPWPQPRPEPSASPKGVSEKNQTT